MTDEFDEEDVPALTVWKIVGAVLASLALGLVACMAGGAIGDRFWILDLLNHFYLQYALIGLAGLVAGMLLKRWVAAGLFGAATIAAFIQLAPLIAASSAPSASGASHPVRMVTLNVLTSNQDRPRVSDWLLAADADVLALLETNEAWVAHLDEVLSAYDRLPTATIRDDNFGMALYVRRGLEVGDVSVLGSPVDVPWIEVALEKEGVSFSVVSIHTRPPIGSHNAEMRDMHMRALATRCQERGGAAGPLVVLGDFNASVWSRPFKSMLKASGLRCACLGAGLGGTWPQGLWLTGMIQIDHVLVSKDVSVVEQIIGTDVGSDHRGVIVDLLL